MKTRTIKVSWLTNLPAPYRIPIWNRLSKSFELSVYSCLSEKNFRGWARPVNENWKHTFLSKWHIRLGEFDYVPNPMGFKKILKGTDLLIVTGWESPIYIAAFIWAKLKKIPSINFYESTSSSHRFKGSLVRLVRRKIFNLADYIVTSGSASTQAVVETGISRKKIVELFNPVDVRFFSEYSNLHREKSGAGHRYLYVGQLIPRKNVLNAIRAFAQIANPDDSLTVVGDGPLRDQIRGLIQELNLVNQVKMMGHKNQEDLAFIYANSDTLVMPSINEVWGLVANEALASGAQVIASDVSGVSDFIKNMKGVYICTPEVESIALRMNESRKNYAGPIKDPEILKFTPERFANELLQLVKNGIK